MHYNYFSSHIYVEKTSEQYCFDKRNSQKAKEDVWWDKYLSKGSNNQ